MGIFLVNFMGASIHHVTQERMVSFVSPILDKQKNFWIYQKLAVHSMTKIDCEKWFYYTIGGICFSLKAESEGS